MKYDQKFINKEAENFTVSKALKGITLASVKQIVEEGETRDELLSVENFRQISSDKFSAVVDGVEHLFDNAGKCVDAPNTVGNLAFVSSDIQKSTQNTADADNTGTSETLKTTATISSLSPRDYFAQEIMNAFMKGINNPFSLSDADIYKYTTLSYKIAQSMINVAAFNRKGDPQSGSTDSSAEVVIDKATLNGNTEKLLNNIVAALDKTNGSVEVPGENDTPVSVPAERLTIPELNALITALNTLVGNHNTLTENYVAHTPTGTEPSTKTTVGLDDLIAAIKGVNVSMDLSTLVSAINSMGTTRTANIGSNGLGSSSSNPLYISGGNSWPSVGSLSRLTSYVYGLIAFDTGDTLGYYRLSDLITKVTTESVFTNAVDARIKQFAADLKTANTGITIPSNWTT